MVMCGVTHSVAGLSSISSWSLRTWAALEKQRSHKHRVSVTTGAASKIPKTPSPTKSSQGLSEVTKHTYSRRLLETYSLLFFRQAFIFWHFFLSPHFIACHWSHPHLLFPKENKIALLMRRTSSAHLSSCCMACRQMSSSSLWLCSHYNTSRGTYGFIIIILKTDRGRGGEDSLQGGMVSGWVFTEGPGGPWGPMLSCVHVQEWGRDGHFASSLWKGRQKVKKLEKRHTHSLIEHFTPTDNWDRVLENDRIQLNKW